ncbi:hypothetical protein [Singulisphaera acidiphila]|uniref:Uncharacterized protein n=1 Tax=Singulisphaera acidiphila (strain ATCC BAA-1392 / DSM 18658 / VKM B-2454 / MOB10) TaxID=886293 RepID=L0DGJ7_SINAD|nr:hypothetical protein [Singulisphaera acidiphila]AGA28377.1 hypothetical protein Sinac_4170 [Singulisphaera acidiphila DSM 18658]
MAANAVTIAKAIIEVGATGVAAAQDEIQTLEAKVRSLGNAYANDQITISAYAMKTNDLKTEILNLSDGIQMAAAASAEFGSKQEALASLTEHTAAKTTTSSKNIQLGFLELSRAFEDAQYGLKGVINNIPSIIQMFDGSAGLAAGVSAVAVAINIAMPHIHNLIESLGSENPKIFDRTLQGIKDKIEAIEKKPIKFDADYQVLTAAKQTLGEITQGLSAYQTIKNRKSSVTEERGKILSDAVVENAGGAENLGNVIEKILKKDKTFTASQGQALIRKEKLEKEIALEEATVKSIEDMGGDDQGMGLVHKEALQKAKVELAKLNVAIQEEGRNKVDTLIGEFSAGSEKARVEIQKMIEANPEAFKAGGVQDLFGSEVDRASDEKIKAQRQEKIDTANEKKRTAQQKILKAEAEKVAQAVEQAQSEKAKPVIDAFVKGKDLAGIAAQVLGDIQREKVAGPDGKPMDGQQQIEFIQNQIRSVIEEELKSRELLNAGSGKAAAAVATSLAGQAPHVLKGQQDHAKKFELESTRKQIDQLVKNEDASIKASGIDKAATEMAAYLKAEGGTVVNGQFRQMNESQQIEFIKDQVARFLHRPMGLDKHGRTVFANPRMDAETTDNIATKVAVGAKSDLDQRMASMAGANMNNTAKLLNIADQLDSEVGRLTTFVASLDRGVNQLRSKVQTRQRSQGKTGR